MQSPSAPEELELRTYYFHDTHERVVARDPRLAAAFYARRYQYERYTYTSTLYTFKSDEEDEDSVSVVVGVLIVQDPWRHDVELRKIEICLEPRASFLQAPEGTIAVVSSGHAVPPGFFEGLLFKGMQVQELDQEMDDYTTNFNEDVLQPLKADFHMLTKSSWSTWHLS